MRTRALLARLATIGLVVGLAATGCAGRGRHRTPGPAPGTASTAPTAAPTASPTAPAAAPAWRRLPPAGLPGSYPVGVWTGTELLIHDFGYDGTTQSNVDAAYSPTRDAWRPLPASPYPVKIIEGGERAVWTGTEMLLFGMLDAAYNPATNRWRPLPGGPAGASAVVWTGRQVLMWGGGCCGQALATGYAYDPAGDSWQPIPASPLTGRHAPGVWTGTELVVVGGWGERAVLADGAAYNPATRTWRRIPPMPAPRTDATLTWTGTEVLVVGGRTWSGPDGTVYSDALAYNPTTDGWRRVPPMPMPRFGHLAVWTGSHLLVWGGQSTLNDPPAVPAHGVAYDPATGTWSAMPASPLKGRRDPVFAWTGRELLVWGGYAAVPPGGRLADGAAYRP